MGTSLCIMRQLRRHLRGLDCLVPPAREQRAFGKGLDEGLERLCGRWEWVFTGRNVCSEDKWAGNAAVPGHIDELELHGHPAQLCFVPCHTCPRCPAQCLPYDTGSAKFLLIDERTPLADSSNSLTVRFYLVVFPS